MKRKSSILIFVLLLTTQMGRSQLGFELGFGPQLATMTGDESLKFFTYSPSVRMLVGPVCFKAGLRKSIPREATTSDYYGPTKTGKFEETGFVIGMSFTFNHPTSRTRPYFVLDYCNISGTLVNTVYDTHQFRFGGGFQFDLRKGFMLFNEATYNSSSYNTVYADSFSIELGLRYFMNL